MNRFDVVWKRLVCPLSLNRRYIETGTAEAMENLGSQVSSCLLQIVILDSIIFRAVFDLTARRATFLRCVGAIVGKDVEFMEFVQRCTVCAKMCGDGFGGDYRDIAMNETLGLRVMDDEEMERSIGQWLKDASLLK